MIMGYRLYLKFIILQYTKQETRPEPWYEIKACELLNSYSNYNFDNLELEPFVINCIRKRKCNACAKIFDDKRKLFNSHPLIKKLHENNIKFVTNIKNNSIELKHNYLEQMLKYSLALNSISINIQPLSISCDNVIQWYNSSDGLIDVLCDYCGLNLECKCNESNHELCKKFISLENSFCNLCNKKFDLQINKTNLTPNYLNELTDSWIEYHKECGILKKLNALENSFCHCCDKNFDLQIDKTNLTPDYLNELTNKWVEHKNSCDSLRKLNEISSSNLYKLNELEKSVCYYCDTKFNLQIDKTNLTPNYYKKITSKWNLAHAHCWIIKYPQDLFIKYNKITEDAFITYTEINKDVYQDLSKNICLKCLFCCNMLQHIYSEDEYEKFNKYMREIYFFQNPWLKSNDIIKICEVGRKRYYFICKKCTQKIKTNTFYNKFFLKDGVLQRDYSLSEKQKNIIKKFIKPIHTI